MSDVTLNIISSTSTTTPKGIVLIGDTAKGEMGVARTVTDTVEARKLFGEKPNYFNEVLYYLLSKRVTVDVIPTGVWGGTEYAGTRGEALLKTTPIPTGQSVREFRQGKLEGGIIKIFLHDGLLNKVDTVVEAITAPASATISNKVTEFSINSVSGSIKLQGDYATQLAALAVSNKTFIVSGVDTSVNGTRYFLYNNANSVVYNSATNTTQVFIKGNSTIQSGAVVSNVYTTPKGIIVYNASDFTISIDGDKTDEINAVNYIQYKISGNYYNIPVLATTYTSGNTIININPAFYQSTMTVGDEVSYADEITEEHIIISGSDFLNYKDLTVNNTIEFGGNPNGFTGTYLDIVADGTNSKVELDSGITASDITGAALLTLATGTAFEFDTDLTTHIQTGEYVSLVNSGYNGASHEVSRSVFANSKQIVGLTNILPTTVEDTILNYYPESSTNKIVCGWKGANSNNVEVTIKKAASGSQNLVDIDVYYESKLIESLKDVVKDQDSAGIEIINDYFDTIKLETQSILELGLGTYQLSSGSRPIASESDVIDMLENRNPITDDYRIIAYPHINPNATILTKLKNIADGIAGAKVFVGTPLNLSAYQETIWRDTTGIDSYRLRFFGTTVTYPSMMSISSSPTFKGTSLALGLWAAANRLKLSTYVQTFYLPLGNAAVSPTNHGITNVPSVSKQLKDKGITTVVTKSGITYLTNNVNASSNSALRNEVAVAAIDFLHFKLLELASSDAVRESLANPDTWNYIFHEFRKFVLELVTQQVIDSDYELSDDFGAQSLGDLIYNNAANVQQNGVIQVGLKFKAYNTLETIVLNIMAS